MAETKTETKVGEVTHFFDKIGVAIIKLEKMLKKGDTIKIKGNTTDLEQTVDSMQVDHADIEEASPGDEIGIKVSDKVREGDEVYK